MTKHGYKNTEIGWIPNEWEVRELGKMGKIFNGLTYDPKDIDEDEGILVLRSSNIQNRQIALNDNVYVKVDEGKFIPVQQGDILICVRNGSKSLIGKNAIIDSKSEGLAFGAFMSVFRSEFNNFFFHLFDTNIYKKEIQRNLGATINSINGSDLRKFLVPLPPLPEQKKIAEILSTWDKAIESTEKLIDAKTKLKQGLMQKLLTGKLRFKEFENEKWRMVNLGDVTELFSRRNKKLNEARIYSVTNNNGFVFQSDHFSREVAGDDLSNYKIIKKNEFAYNPARINVGSIAHFKDEIGVISSLYVCFRTTNDLLDEYMSYLLQIESTKFKIRNFGEGGVRVYLWYPLFATIKVTIPNINEQKKISDSLHFLDKEIELLCKQLEAHKEQKKGLMQKLLTGEVRVKISEEEK